MSDYQKERLNQKIFGKEPKKIDWPKKKVVSKIKRYSEKRFVENEIYSIRRKSYLAKHRLCECGCGREATEIHHKKGRKGKYNGVSLLIVVKFFMAVSSYCHKKIEANPEWAKKMGYSLIRNTKTEKQPIMKKQTLLLIIFLLTLGVIYSFTDDKSAKAKVTNADTTKPGKKDTVFYISNTREWFVLLYKSLDSPKSISNIERAALLGWVGNARFYIDSTKGAP